MCVPANSLKYRVKQPIPEAKSKSKSSRYKSKSKPELNISPMSTKMMNELIEEKKRLKEKFKKLSPNCQELLKHAEDDPSSGSLSPTPQKSKAKPKTTKKPVVSILYNSC